MAKSNRSWRCYAAVYINTASLRLTAQSRSQNSFSDILNAYNLIIVLYLLDHPRSTNLSDHVDKFTDWERFQSLAFELISPRNQANSGEEADKSARDFTASTASA
jgi:hypothetical protein